MTGPRALLLEKGRPAWLAGLWNGIGGHVERGEYPFDAMVREAAEEAALPPLPWAHPGVINTTQDESDPLGTAQLVVFAAPRLSTHPEITSIAVRERQPV